MPIRRRDVRRLRRPARPLVSASRPRGPALPVAAFLAENVGFAIDLVVHVGGAVGVALALTHVPRLAHYASYQLPAAVGTFLALSIVHRVVVQ